MQYTTFVWNPLTRMTIPLLQFKITIECFIIWGCWSWWFIYRNVFWPFPISRMRSLVSGQGERRVPISFTQLTVAAFNRGHHHVMRMKIITGGESPDAMGRDKGPKHIVLNRFWFILRFPLMPFYCPIVRPRKVGISSFTIHTDAASVGCLWR